MVGTQNKGVYVKLKDVKKVAKGYSWLFYKEQDIAKEFIGVLSNEEKEEFREISIESLVKKYKMAIIDRT